MVHQLDHFVDELAAITDTYVQRTAAADKTSSSSALSFGDGLSAKYKPRSSDAFYVDRAWQAIAVSQCLFDCTDSVVF